MEGGESLGDLTLLHLGYLLIRRLLNTELFLGLLKVLVGIDALQKIATDLGQRSAAGSLLNDLPLVVVHLLIEPDEP